MIEKLQAHYGFTRMPFGRDLAPGMLHRHAAHNEAVARITWCITLMMPKGLSEGLQPSLQWTTMSTRSLAAELRARGHRVSPWTVTNLLSEEGFSLQASPGKLSESRRLSKDAQFASISEQATAHLAQSQPVIVFTLGKRKPRAEALAIGATQVTGGYRPRLESRTEPAVGRASGSLLARTATGGKEAVGPVDSADDWMDVRPDGDTVIFALMVIRTWWQQAKHLFRNAERLLLVASRGAPPNVADHLLRSGLPTFAGDRHQDQHRPAACCHRPVEQGRGAHPLPLLRRLPWRALRPPRGRAEPDLRRRQPATSEIRNTYRYHGQLIPSPASTLTDRTTGRTAQ